MLLRLEMCSKNAGLQGSTLSGHRMTTVSVLFRPEDIMLTDLRIILFFYALKYASYPSNMFPIIPV